MEVESVTSTADSGNLPSHQEHGKRDNTWANNPGVRLLKRVNWLSGFGYSTNLKRANSRVLHCAPDFLYIRSCSAWCTIQLVWNIDFLTFTPTQVPSLRRDKRDACAWRPLLKYLLELCPGHRRLLELWCLVLCMNSSGAETSGFYWWDWCGFVFEFIF